MGLFSGIGNIVGGLLGGGGGGGQSGIGNKSAETQNATTTTNNDNRLVVGENGFAVGTNGSYYNVDNSNRSVNTSVYDTSDHSLAYSYDYATTVTDTSDHSLTDNSNRSVANSGNTSTSYNYTGTDGGAVQIAKYNADFLQATSEHQLDSVKALASFGNESLRNQAELLNNSYAQAGSNQAKAWSATLDTSEAVLDKLFAAAAGTTTAAQAVAQSAIASFQPSENKTGDATKYAAVAAVGLVGLLLLSKVKG